MCSLASNKNGSSCQAEHHRIARQKQFNQVAIGTRVTPRARHRAVRAELRHTTPASSHDAKRWFGYGWGTLTFRTRLSTRWSTFRRSYATADCAAARRTAIPADLGPEGTQPSQVTRGGMVIQVSLSLPRAAGGAGQSVASAWPYRAGTAAGGLGQTELPLAGHRRAM